MKGNLHSFNSSFVIELSQKLWSWFDTKRRRHPKQSERRYHMTANQVAYYKATEEARHNLETERQKDRDIAIGERNALSQRISSEASAKAAEASRVQAEVAGLRQSEEARHNFEQEGINWWSTRTGISETQRHNIVEEQRNALATRSLVGLQSSQGEAAIRQAAASETSAYANMLRSQASQIQAEASSLNAKTQQSALAETVRHNKEAESYQYITAAASRSQASTARKKQEVEAEISRKNATSTRIGAVSSAVNAGVNAATAVSKLATSIVMGVK